MREFRKGPRAVDGIDLEVAPGEIYGFLGPNGAGKSTTVLVLTTLLPPTSGSARVAGFDVARQGPQVRRAIGAALQEAALDPMLTGRDHLRLQTMLQGIPRAERRTRTDELLERVGLGFAADRKVGGYSGRHEAAARSRARARPPPAADLPRRADDRPRPAEPPGAVGGGGPPAQGGRRHRVPHDPVPRGGGRAGRPDRDHRPRPDRRRGHAVGAQGRDRAPERARHPGPSRRARARRTGPRAVRRAAAADRRDRGRGAAHGRRLARGRRPRARRGRPGDRRHRAPGPDARRRLPREDGAFARGLGARPRIATRRRTRKPRSGPIVQR